MSYVVLCNPLHEGEMHVVTGVDPLGASTIATGRDLPPEALIVDSFLEALKMLHACTELDERYFPWISPFVAAVDGRRVTAAIVNSEVLETAHQDEGMRMVLDPLGIPIEAVRDHGGFESPEQA